LYLLEESCAVETSQPEVEEVTEQAVDTSDKEEVRLSLSRAWLSFLNKYQMILV